MNKLKLYDFREVFNAFKEEGKPEVLSLMYMVSLDLYRHEFKDPVTRKSQVYTLTNTHELTLKGEF